MLNLGLIGNTEILEPHALKAKQFSNINIIGKASVGSSSQLNSFHYSIPEFNRVELLERADLILMDNSTPLPYKLMCEIVKKSKHIYCAQYPELTVEECTDLIKLVNESGSVVQIYNPYYFTPAIQWLNNNISTPAFIEYANFERDNDASESLYSMLLMLIGITGISAKKVGAITFPGFNNSKFSNVRLEFGDASVVNLNFGKLESLMEFKIRVYSDNQFTNFNFTENIFLCDNKPVEFKDEDQIDELKYFIDTVERKEKRVSCLEDYLIAMQAIQKINKKLKQFSVH